MRCVFLFSWRKLESWNHLYPTGYSVPRWPNIPSKKSCSMGCALHGLLTFFGPLSMLISILLWLSQLDTFLSFCTHEWHENMARMCTECDTGKMYWLRYSSLSGFLIIVPMQVFLDLGFWLWPLHQNFCKLASRYGFQITKNPFLHVCNNQRGVPEI